MVSRVLNLGKGVVSAWSASVEVGAFGLGLQTRLWGALVYVLLCGDWYIGRLRLQAACKGLLPVYGADALEDGVHGQSRWQNAGP
jgi:hypothetical protein